MNPLDALLADLVETLANRSLAGNARAQERLAALEGRCMHIECAAPPKTLTLEVRGSRLAVSAEAVGKPDVSVRGSAAELLGWLAAGAPESTGKLGIAGDVDSLQAIITVLKPSAAWLEGLADGLFPKRLQDDWLGGIELGAAAARSVTEGAVDALRRGLAVNYLEATELQGFNTALDRLRQRADFLADRVQALQRPPAGEAP